MSEKTEGQDIGTEAVAGGVDPAAVALALAALIVIAVGRALAPRVIISQPAI